jgi:hypothetical protein
MLEEPERSRSRTKMELGWRVGVRKVVEEEEKMEVFPLLERPAFRNLTGRCFSHISPLCSCSCSCSHKGFATFLSLNLFEQSVWAGAIRAR